MTDFGAERAFGPTTAQVKEPCGLSVDQTSLLRLVEGSAVQAEECEGERLSTETAAFEVPQQSRPGVDEALVELDGCNRRIGSLEVVRGDDVAAVRGLPTRRRVVQWREVRVGFARVLQRGPCTRSISTYPGP